MWTIGGWQVEVTPSTQISGNAVVGAKVECSAWTRADAIPLAISITVLASPEATPEPVEFQGYIEAIGNPWWTIGGFKVKVLPDTQLSPNLAVGDRVSVRALKQSTGELWATSITAATATEVQVDGTIEAYSAGSSITIDGVRMSITPATQIVGAPAVGRQAQARALQYSDGSLIATVIVVMEPPTPEPTYTPTPQPSATPTIEVTAAPTTTTAPTATSDPTTTPIP